MKLHVICHTHWDREWFITHDYTNKLLVVLFEKLLHLIRKNKNYIFVLDGQTLIIEDLLKEQPDLEDEVKKYVESGNLLIGPHYCQIDWRLSSEASIIMNFIIGNMDTKRFGRMMKVGWLLDNFGHISQTVQLHKIFNINGVVIWRGYKGKPMMEFIWESPDGSRLPAVFLIGGYRNIYSLSSTPDIAKERIKHEINKLERFTITGNIPLLDGYDLDIEPEDPTEFIKDISSEKDEFIISDPEKMMDEMKKHESELEILHGEMLSGKYACVFPGSLSTRNYLKVESNLIESILSKYISCILSVLKRMRKLEDNVLKEYEFMWRDVLKTLNHDNICGVGVDQIHDGMEETYAKSYEKSKEFLKKQILRFFNTVGFGSGVYVFNVSPHEYDIIYTTNTKRKFKMKVKGTGFYKVEELESKFEKSKNTNIKWKNDYYEFEVKDEDFLMNGRKIGFLVLEKELGDAYSSYTEPMKYDVKIKESKVLHDEHTAFIELKRELSGDKVHIETDEQIILDQTPILRWNLKIKSKGKSYKLRIGMEGITHEGEKMSIHAKMPFDIVERNKMEKMFDDLPDYLERVLLAARETIKIDEFPFQGFVFLKYGKKLNGIMAKGLKEYKVDEKDNLMVTLIRSVDWITQSLPNRAGDAGPLMYVPAAKCEREMNFELGFFALKTNEGNDLNELFKWFDLFYFEPLFFEYNTQNHSEREYFHILDDEIEWIYMNPFEDDKVEVFYVDFSNMKIGKKDLDMDESTVLKENFEKENATCLNFINFPQYPVFKDESELDENEMEKLKSEMKKLEETVNNIEKDLSELEGIEFHKKKHKLLSSKRTILELKLSLLLNEMRYGLKKLSEDEITELIFDLNKRRSKRRVYDYILEYYLSRSQPKEVPE